ncbi:hypothetical protein ED733_001071 [Metarhizium rileyi]|uniref:Uncharacterized protein n=1 Tax=Metarhizium rileyi (strain RCEF 4871) TaxID=1649241 RepID=A0A5C6G0K4_METRR|nr:hypothetical protein ED733_001071 [Metarhizium rileyi]
MSLLSDAADILRSAALLIADQEVPRGRKRSRSSSRTAGSKSLRPDESSTLRGRSGFTTSYDGLAGSTAHLALPPVATEASDGGQEVEAEALVKNTNLFVLLMSSLA